MTWGQGGSVPKRIKDAVRRRDGVCQLQYTGCTQAIEEYDHPIGLAEQGLPRTNVTSALELVGACKHCHGIKTERQRREGIQRAIHQRGGLSRRHRDKEPHPGAIDPYPVTPPKAK